MDQPNFFQSKLAMTKAFPDKRMTLGKVHQLYHEIYGSKPKVAQSPTGKADRMSILLNHGESAVYVDEDMKKLLQRFIPSDEDIKFYTKGVPRKSKFKDISKLGFERKDSNFSGPLQKSASDITFPQSEIERVEIGDYIIPLSPDTNTTCANSRRSSPKERKMHPSIQLLKKNIERYSIVSNKTSGKHLEIPPLNDSYQHKSDHDPEVYIKGFRRRVGLEHNKSAVAEYGELVKQVQPVDQQEPLSADKLQHINNRGVKKLRAYHGLSIDVGLSSFHNDKKKDGSHGMSMLVGSQSATSAKILNLPTIAKSPATLGVANQPKMIRTRNYQSKEQIDQLFETCSKVKENINNIDRKLSHDGKKNTKKLASLKNRLRKVMKINFLPPEFILEDDI